MGRYQVTHRAGKAVGGPTPGKYEPAAPEPRGRCRPPNLLGGWRHTDRFLAEPRVCPLRSCPEHFAFGPRCRGCGEETVTIAEAQRARG